MSDYEIAKSIFAGDLVAAARGLRETAEGLEALARQVSSDQVPDASIGGWNTVAARAVHKISYISSNCEPSRIVTDGAWAERARTTRQTRGIKPGA